MKKTFFLSISLILTSVIFLSCISSRFFNSPYIIKNITLKETRVNFDILNKSENATISLKIFIEINLYSDEKNFQSFFEKEILIQKEILPNEEERISFDLKDFLQEIMIEHEADVEEYNFSISKIYLTEIKYKNNSRFEDKYGSWWI